MTDKQTPPDWILIEAAKRSGVEHYFHHLAADDYKRNPTFRALCDMIERYETPPVDQIDEALALQLEAFCPNDLHCYEGRNPVKLFRDGLTRRGIELRKIGEGA